MKSDPMPGEIELAEQIQELNKFYLANRVLDPQNVEQSENLEALCSKVGLPPTSTIISRLNKVGEHPFRGGSITVIWEGNLDGKHVAIKTPKERKRDLKRVREGLDMLWKWAPVWEKLSHQNILPFHGISEDKGLVYDFGENIRDHIKPETNDTTRLSLLLGVAEGLKYLHGLGLVHGRLKGTNIMVEERHSLVHARLTEYGLGPTARFLHPGTDQAIARWQAPEILKEECLESKEADVFAFGIVAVEVLTGNDPFPGMKDTAAAMSIMDCGGKQALPENCPDQLGSLLNECWMESPDERAKMEQIVQTLKVLVKD